MKEDLINATLLYTRVLLGICEWAKCLQNENKSTGRNGAKEQTTMMEWSDRKKEVWENSPFELHVLVCVVRAAYVGVEISV